MLTILPLGRYQMLLGIAGVWKGRWQQIRFEKEVQNGSTIKCMVKMLTRTSNGSWRTSRWILSSGSWREPGWGRTWRSSPCSSLSSRSRSSLRRMWMKKSRWGTGRKCWGKLISFRRVLQQTWTGDQPSFLYTLSLVISYRSYHKDQIISGLERLPFCISQSQGKQDQVKFWLPSIFCKWFMVLL